MQHTPTSPCLFVLLALITFTGTLSANRPTPFATTHPTYPTHSDPSYLTPFFFPFFFLFLLTEAGFNVTLLHTGNVLGTVTAVQKFNGACKPMIDGSYI